LASQSDSDRHGRESRDRDRREYRHRPGVGLAFAKRGAHVVVADVDDAGGESVAEVWRGSVASTNTPVRFTASVRFQSSSEQSAVFAEAVWIPALLCA
jgi:hypothetical protein